MNARPTEWRTITLGDAGKWGSGGTPQSTNQSYYDGQIPWIRSGDLPDGPILTHTAKITDEGLRNSSAKWVPADAILIALYGATIGKLGITTYPVTTNQAVAFCVPDRQTTFAEYLYWYLLYARPELIDLGQGGAQPNISQTILKRYPLAVPPIDEQRRVVAHLNSLFKRTKSARQELARIPRLIQRYKGAILTSAFRGELTADWRMSNGISISKDWSETALGDLSKDVRYGTAAKCHYEPKNTPVLRIPNVVNGSIDTTDLKYGSFSKSEIEKLALQNGDLLVIRSNGSLDLVGRAALASEGVVGFLYAGYLIRLRFDLSRVNPAFIRLAFEELSFRERIERLAKSTSGVNNINSEQIKALRLRVPPLREQCEIVRRAESAFARVGGAGEQTSRALGLLYRL